MEVRSLLLLLAMISAGAAAEPTVYFVISDHLGTPQRLVDKNQTIVWTAEYEPFGKATADEDPDGDGHKVEMPLRFPGQYYDAETGLHYNYFRDYDPSLGRYIQSDPIGLRGGLNTYTYVSSNPLIWIDPYGLVQCTCIAINSGGIGYINGIKQCRYSCRTADGKEVIVDAPGVDDSRGDYCLGADVRTTVSPGGAITNVTNSLDPFDVDTESWIDRYIRYGTDLTEAIDNAYEQHNAR